MPTVPENPLTPGWGVGKELPSPFESCIITEWETATEAVTAYCQDNKGAVCHAEDYDAKTTVSATLLAPASVELSSVTPGDATVKKLTVGGVVFRILRLREIQSNTAFQKVAIELERYENWPAA